MLYFFTTVAQVIFLQNIKNVAQVGDLKTVADGYARNFLLPRKLAVLATPSAMKTVESLKQKRLMAIDKDKETVAQMAEKFKTFVLEIGRIASEEGTLYDGLGASEISSYLKKQGFNIEPEAIPMKESIKKLGAHEAEIDLGYDTKATLKIDVKKQAE